MNYDSKTLKYIYDKSSGYCHICHHKAYFSNYNRVGAKGAWEVDHSNPQNSGGSDRLNNLFVAHISCNRSKQDHSTRTARAWNGKTKAPLSRSKRKEAKRSNAVALGLLGGVVGSIAGPWGAAAGATIGAKIGYDLNPDKT